MATKKVKARKPQTTSDSAKPSPQNVQDGWQNLFTGLGVSGSDKRLETSFIVGSALDELTLEGLYRSGGIGARIVDVLTEDMTRKGFTVTGDTDNSVMKYLKRFKGYPAIIEAVRWAMLYGGSLGVIGIRDGGLYEEAVNEGRIESITHIHVFDRFRTSWTTSDLYSNPEDPKFGLPQWYTIFPINPLSGSGLATSPATGRAPSASGIPVSSPKGTASASVGAFRVHESRVLRFDGRLIPLRARVANRYWNDSVIQPVYENLRGVGEAICGIESLVSEFVLGILRMNNLQAMIAGGKEDIIKKRLLLMDMTKHVKNTVLLDTNEEYQRIAASTAGLADLIDRLLSIVSAVTGIPVTVLMGEAPAGLNATGQADLRRYYDKIEALQTATMQEPCEKLIRYMTLAGDSKITGLSADETEVKFTPLYALTELEDAQLKSQIATADSAYVAAKVLQPHEVAKSRFGGDHFSAETKLDDTRSEDGRLSAADELKMNPPPPEPMAPEQKTGGKPASSSARGPFKQKSLTE